MGCHCSNTQKKAWSLGCAGFLIVIAIILGVVWPPVINKTIDKSFVLEPGSKLYDIWTDSPIPMYLEIYMWNWTNYDKIYDRNVKPHFDQVGPFIFKEIHERVDVNWDEKVLVTFNQKRIWHFEEGLSKGKLSDRIWNLDVIYLVAGYTTQGHPKQQFIDQFINLNQEELNIFSAFWEGLTVGELLFDGYEVPLLRALVDIVAEIPPELIPPGILPDPLVDRFGWFYGRNDSKTYDGVFTMGTGVGSKANLGVLTLWNGANRTDFYRDNCGEIRGTTGEVWPPITDVKEDVTVFAPDICSSMTLKYEGDVEKLGVKGAKWVGDDSVFDDGNKYEEAKCWCTAAPEACPVWKPGVLDVSKCKLGAPALVSFPHFYLADPSYTAKITGMNASKEEHEFFMALEPQYGLPIQVKAQLQVNLDLRDYGLTFLKDVPEILVPVLWFRQTAELDEALAKDVRLLFKLPSIGVWVAYGIGGLGVLLMIIFVFLSCTIWSSKTMTV